MESIRGYLDQIPDPIRCCADDEMAEEWLSISPTRAVSASLFAHVFDELHDKLSTTLEWNELDVPTWIVKLADDTRLLDTFVQNSLISEGILPIVNQATRTISQTINWPILDGSNCHCSMMSCKHLATAVQQ